MDRALVEIAAISDNDDTVISDVADLLIRLVSILVAKLAERELATVVGNKRADVVKLAPGVARSFALVSAFRFFRRATSGHLAAIRHCLRSSQSFGNAEQVSGAALGAGDEVGAIAAHTIDGGVGFAAAHFLDKLSSFDRIRVELSSVFHRNVQVDTIVGEGEPGKWLTSIRRHYESLNDLTSAHDGELFSDGCDVDLAWLNRVLVDHRQLSSIS